MPRFLPKTFSRSSILKSEGCEHLRKIGQGEFKFPEGLGSVECDKVIDIITQHFLRDFWAIKGREAARASAEAKHAEVCFPLTCFSALCSLLSGA